MVIGGLFHPINDIFLFKKCEYNIISNFVNFYLKPKIFSNLGTHLARFSYYQDGISSLNSPLFIILDEQAKNELEWTRRNTIVHVSINRSKWNVEKYNKLRVAKYMKNKIPKGYKLSWKICKGRNCSKRAMTNIYNFLNSIILWCLRIKINILDFFLKKYFFLEFIKQAAKVNPFKSWWSNV